MKGAHISQRYFFCTVRKKQGNYSRYHNFSILFLYPYCFYNKNRILCGVCQIELIWLYTGTHGMGYDKLCKQPKIGPNKKLRKQNSTMNNRLLSGKLSVLPKYIRMRLFFMRQNCYQMFHGYFVLYLN